MVAFSLDETPDVGRLRARGVEVHLGSEDETLTQGIDLVVKSPGVRADAPLVAAARARGVPDLGRARARRASPREPRSSASPGRTGRRRPPRSSARCSASMDARSRSRETSAARSGRSSARSRRTPGSSARSACSSSTTSQVFHPRIGVLVNLEPDHLDRYGDFEDYAATKLRMFALQTEDDTAVLPRGFGPCREVRAPSSSRPTIRSRPSRPSRAAQPRERRGGYCGGARGRNRRRRDRPCARDLRGRRAPDRGGRDDRRCPLRERLEGDERGGRAACARVDSSERRASSSVVAGRREPYAPLAAALQGGRPRLPHRRGGQTRFAAALAQQAFRSSSPVTSDGGRAGRGRGIVRRGRPPLARVCELRPVPRLRGPRRRVPRLVGALRWKSGTATPTSASSRS